MAAGALVAASESGGSGARRAALAVLAAVVVVQGLAVPVTFLLPLLLLWGGLLVLGVMAWNKVQRSAWPAWAAWLAVAILALDPAAVFLVLVVLPGALYCGGAKRAVLAEFSQYQDAKAEAVADLETGACALAFTTR